MNKNSIVFIGLDTHKEFTEVVYCLDQRGGDLDPIYVPEPDDPRKLMNYVGLTPSEYSSGGERKLSSMIIVEFTGFIQCVNSSFMITNGRF